MKIAIITNFKKPIPSPKDSIYAPGVIIANLANGLVELGHSVEVFAAEESTTGAKLNTLNLKSAYANFGGIGRNLEGELQLELLAASAAVKDANAGKFDLVHFHDHRRFLHFLPFLSKPAILTFHGDINDDTQSFFNKERLKVYRDMYSAVAVTDFQAKAANEYLPIATTIHHGIDIAKFKLNRNPKKDLLYLGRIIARKGPDLAIEAALKTKRHLTIIGAPGDSIEDQNYWSSKIKPLINNNPELIEYLGHLAFDKVQAEVGNYQALLIPLRKPEAFGLVMIEAMLAGTPVIAFDIGGVKEIVSHEVSGFVQPSTINGLAEGINRVGQLSRLACRDYAKVKFAKERMVKDYEEYYKLVLR